MAESLNLMTVVGGQVVVLYVDQANPLIPKVIIPEREHFDVGEKIIVFCGDTEVGFHTYRSGDFFPIHLPLDKEVLGQVQGAGEVYYKIKHLDGTTSTSTSFRAKVEVFNSQSSVSHANEIKA
jgi:hypothetical protein